MENISIEFLKSIELFSSLSDEELCEVRTKVALKEVRKNEVILYEEDTNEFMYIVVVGKVKVFQVSEDGKATILAFHSSGDFFGEMSLIDGETVPATVSATENSLIAIISKKDFYALIFNQENILGKFLQILCSRLRISWKKIHMLNFNNASQRIKMLFLMHIEKYGNKTDEGIVLSIKLTHQNMAEMTGLTRETITRVLDRWQRNGEITILKNKFVRLNPDFLHNNFEDEL